MSRSKFRLKMARQQGEQKAREFGQDAFPIRPEQIAAAEGISIEAKPAPVKGVSGGIVMTEHLVAIFYSASIKNDGFRRFTIGHELGHYFLEGHAQEIQSAPSGTHISRSGFSQGDQSIEIEADHFSSGLLMPTQLTKRLLRGADVGLRGICALAKEADCSLTASAIRAAECCDYPLAVIVSEGTEILYGFWSDSLRALRPGDFPRKGCRLPDTATLAFNEQRYGDRLDELIDETSDTMTWFSGDKEHRLREEVVGLGEYGKTLTILTGEKSSGIDDDEDQDEIGLEESWMPRFAYGR